MDNYYKRSSDMYYIVFDRYFKELLLHLYIDYNKR